MIASTLNRGIVRRVARAIRYAPVLRSFDGLWNALRVPYRRFMELGDAGVPCSIGGVVTIPLPADQSAQNWEQYEPDAVRRYVDWVRSHDAPLVLDVGASIGIYSVAALLANPRARVIAFDSDLASLRLTLTTAERAGVADRLSLVYGFVSETHLSGVTVERVATETRRRLETLPRSPRDAEIRYVCLEGDRRPADVDAIPVHSIDGLLADAPPTQILLKCDIEGAESLALRGARRLLNDAKPTICLSVHPTMIGEYGTTVTQLSDTLREAGYSVDVFDRDWEEHWWCEAGLRSDSH